MPLSPVRLFDSRIGTAGPVCAGGTIAVQVSGHAGVPAGASAVALNVTAAEANDSGYVTIWPEGSTRTNTSNINLSAAGQTRANLVVVGLSAEGALWLHASGGAHIIIDVAGYFVPADLSAGGRFTGLTPARVLDTRFGNGAPAGVVAAGETLSAVFAGRGGLPTNGVSAVVLNVTAADALAAGYVTVWPSGQSRPDASVLNLEDEGDVASNLVIVPLGSGGAVSFFTERGGNLIADAVGYFTDDSATTSDVGLFVPLNGSRLIDTRHVSPIAGGATFFAKFAGKNFVPTNAQAVALNVTGVDALAAGFLTVFPATASRPDASTLNLSQGDTRANEALMRLGADGNLAFFSEAGNHLVVDVTGYFRGSPT